MATQLQIVNNVLRRLRESPVTSITDTEYSILVADFVNEGLMWVQEAHDWSVLETPVGFPVTANKIWYDLRAVADGGDADWGARMPTSKSYILHAPNNVPLVWVQDQNSPTQSRVLPLVDPAYAEHDQWTLGEHNESAERVEYASIAPHESYDSWWMKVWPNTTNVDVGAGMPYVWARWWIPQEPLALDGTDNGTRIIVRSDLVQAYALRTALNERGEEMGEPGNMADQRLQMFLQNAIETDLQLRSRTNRYEVYPD
jgi:hypothetical protein